MLTGKMIRVLNYPSNKAEAFLKRIFFRIEEFPQKLERAIRQIGLEVRRRGDKALIEYTQRFDGVSLRPEEFLVESKEIERAYEEIDQALLEAIRVAVERVKAFHQRQIPLSWFESGDEGTLLGQLIRPVESAGLYIPGGKGGETPLISTVIMTAVPASLAGVKRIVMVSPPRRDKSLHPALLVAAKEAGVSEVYRVGGPWSIFALAYGTETIRPVQVICGPGNIYVTLAKKLVSFQVGIDLLAGPSEVLIIADEKADPDFIVWDLLAQAEHDPLSMSLLITISKRLIREVREKLSEALKRGYRTEIAQESLKKRGALIWVESLEQAFELANRIAPEHLELLLENPEAYLPLIRNAGAVFLGAFTPEAVGDYIAGPNHVLPTMGLARFSSGLSVDRFFKRINFMKYTPQALKSVGPMVITLALNESLPSHAEAVRIRLEKMGGDK